MEKIASFTIDHIRLLPGVYVSRKDTAGQEVITTFDLRMTSPNDEPVMNTAEVHTIEHLGATFLRNHQDYGNKTIYFGPMGCPPASICCWQEITILRILFLWSLRCLNTSGITEEKFPAPPPGTAATIWI